MTLEPFKYLIQPVALERDDETGRIVGEKPAQIVTVFTAEDAARAVTEFEAALIQLQEEGEPHEPDDGNQDNGRAEADAAERTPTGRVRQS